jgi:hypothetical protein
MGHTTTKIVLVLVGLLAGLYALAGVGQLVGVLFRNGGSPYEVSNIAANVVPVCLGLIVCVACFRHVLKRGKAATHNGAAVPSYPGVYVEEFSTVPTIKGVSTSTTAFVGSAPAGPVDEPVTITSFAEFEQQFGGLWTESRLGFSVRDFFLNGGTHAVVIRVNHAASGTISDADFIDPGKELASEGLFALKKADLVNLLCIPPYNQQDNVDANVLAAAVRLCEDRRAFSSHGSACRIRFATTQSKTSLPAALWLACMLELTPVAACGRLPRARKHGWLAIRNSVCRFPTVTTNS